MEERISEIRANILVNEYLRQIYKYKTKYSNFSDFPYLTNTEFLDAYYSKKIEVRSHLRMISIAVLSEYMSVRLNPELSEKIYSIANQELDFPKKLNKDEPLISLLIKLHINRVEINSDYHANINHFESFMILEREFRIENKFKELLYLVAKTDEESFTAYTKQLNKNRNDSIFWNASYLYKNEGELIKNQNVFFKIIILLNFLNDISNLIKSVKSDLISSSFWFYYKHFFSAIGIISPQLIQFLKALKAFERFSGFNDSSNFTNDEISQIESEILMNIDNAIDNINFLIEQSFHNALTKFIDTSFELEFVLAISGNYDEIPDRIDMETLRNSVKG